ncbi:MAG: CHAP domain-containing protein [Pseudolysinimonas sp.]
MTPTPAPTPVASDAPVYLSRREARAAGGFSTDAADTARAAAAPAPAAPAPAAPAYDGIASLFPLLGDVTSSPLTTDLAAPSAFDAILAPSPAELGATQAISVADVAAELATPVAPYVVVQSAPIPIVPSWHAADAFPAAAPSSLPRGEARTISHHGAERMTSHPATERSASRRRDAPRPAPKRTVTRYDESKKPLRQRVFGVGVMLAVGGLFAVLAIPAYADNNVATLTAAAAVQTQKVYVAKDAASTISTTARGGYTATSASDLRSMYAAAIREQNIAAYLKSGARDRGDDYPWFAELSRNQGGGLSPLGYYYRECVDFVAWRLNRDAGTTSAPYRWAWSQLTPNGGNAREWKSAWLNHGWPTGTTPVPGAVAWFSGANHVAYVNGILENGQVLIEEYNYGTPHQYATRVINPGDAYYLYAPPK